MKLALGTVQFGQPYGVANRTGVPDDTTLDQILTRARAGGICVLDTAVLYGNAEIRLGQADTDGFEIITKLPPLPSDCTNISGWVDTQLTESAARLGRDHLDGVLCHHAHDLVDLADALGAAKTDGRVRRTGVSIYDPDELVPLLGTTPLDLVQGPLNVLDQRIITTGWLARLQDAGVGFHARSAFLQGSLLMTASDRPAYFQPWSPQFALWDTWVAETGLTPLAAALAALKATSGVEAVVLGVDHPAQLDQILHAFDAPAVSFPAHLSCDDLNLISPSNWSLP